jgi:tripartite ATP-independent transporter DctM subunit
MMILVAFTVLMGLLALAIPVAAAMGILALVLAYLYSPLPLILAAGEITWSASTSFILSAVPFFVLLGEILLRSGIAERMYAALTHWVSWLPGGLMHSNIAACAMFAATSGSSVATAATIGTVAVEQIEKNKYHEPLFLGSLASGGTLGILIPPSINLIVYGVLTETSIPQLYLAGFIPGLLLAALFSLTILFACMLRPAWGGVPFKTNWAARWRSLPDLVPPIVIFLLVVGSIYAGLATPTEAAGMGVIGGLVIAGMKKRLSFAMLRDCLEGTMKTSAMIVAIVVGAYFLNFVITNIGLTQKVNSTITELGLSPQMTLLAIIIFYLVLGCFMETLSMMVATVPITATIMVNMGYDSVWYGILIVVLIETAMITPPVGINLYVIQGLRKRGHLHEMMAGATPFVVTLLMMIGLLVLFPGLALWLPRIMSGR